MKILDIKEVSYKGMDGFVIQTDAKAISILINTSQCCCENWGYLSTLDDLSDFNGASIDSVYMTDDRLESTDLKLDDVCVSVESCYFVNISTNRGVMQFTVYNEHNGYYGHGVKITIGDEVLLDDYL